jgi:DGQHR domain-containing protein
MEKSKIYNFKSKEDFYEGIQWMKNFLTDELEDFHKHDDPESVAEEIEGLIESIDSLDYNSKTDWKKIWETVNKINDETYHHQREPDPIYWGIWRLNQSQELSFGYKEGYLQSANVVAGGDIKLHTYHNVPPPIIWKLKKISQKDITFYTTSAKVHEIEQVSSVPSLPKTMSPEEAGKRILDPNRAPNEWQRRPIAKRIESIKEFVEVNENIIANSPILYIKECPGITINDEELIIDFEGFLKRKETKESNSKNVYWCDYENLAEDINENNSDINFKDLRPVWLIDGQHRVRGLSRSIQGGELSIPIIIFPPQFGLPRAAKIFAEINTLQESLKPLHKLFMQHRFKIASPISNRNFEEWEKKPNEHRDSRANHLSYELIAKLACREDSALNNKVKLLDQNEGDFYVKADQWVNFSRGWFLSGPYESFLAWPKDRDEDIYQEVNNYFRAFIETVNHKEWRDGKERWSESSKRKSILQSSTHFKALIDLYDEVHHRIRKSGKIITTTEFKVIMAPFKWVDWIDQDLRKMYSGGGEKGRTSLFIWMFDALKSKVSHPLNAVMSKTIKSEPGKGILAPPKKSEIIVHGEWPTKTKSVQFKSERPKNARKKPTWILMDEKGETYNFLKIKSNEECELQYDSRMDKIKYFKISVIWSNASSTNATSTVKIINQ